MINHLHIQNFKCLRDTSLSFSPLTVLTDPNDSGKTSILEPLLLVGQTSTTPLSQIFMGSRSIENINWRREFGGTPAWELRGKVPLETSPVEFRYSKWLVPWDLLSSLARSEVPSPTTPVERSSPLKPSRRRTLDCSSNSHNHTQNDPLCR